jgi:hypothetical protein
MSNIPTAEEFLCMKDVDDCDMILSTTIHNVRKAMIEFAKLHVEAALKAASENAEIRINDNYSESYSLVKSEIVNYNSMGVYNVYAEECTNHRIEVFEESILNAYPLDLIK